MAVAGGPIGDATTSPFPEEAAAIARAVDKRRREFVAGRDNARAALAQLGLAVAGIAVAPSRAPQWPRGSTGSISHSADACVAVVAATADYAGVGIDIEPAAALLPTLHATVLHPDELAAIRPAPGIDPAKMLFVVKEAFFKLYHPLTGHFLDFLDVDVQLELDRGAFRLALRDGAPAIAGQRVFTGACGLAGGYCFALVVLAGGAEKAA
jgi:4'-phosphopantetheinyl transferase EntD